MDVTHACRCCLRRAPDKDLTTPYTHLGITEIYADMIKECFDINMILGGSGSCGICTTCVCRLRDATNFKLQVLRSQAELQARLQGESSKALEEECAVEPEYPEMQDEDGTSEPVSGEEPPVKLETLDAWVDETPDDILHDMLRLNTAAGDGASDEGDRLLVPDARAREQLAMACSVVLERLRDDATIHSGDKPCACEYCGKRFENKSILRKHVQITHSSSGPEEFACAFCSSPFHTESLLLEHEKIEHGVTDFVCSECEYTTIYKRSFHAHLKTHTEDKLFNCTSYSYKSPRKSDLHNHLAKLTGDKTHKRAHNREKPFHKCGYCSYQSRHKGHLQWHIRTHTGEKPYTCNYCDKKCSRKSHLQSHQMIHTGAKPFQCSHCDYKCSRKSHLQLHQMIHTGAKPFKCSECDYSCRQKGNLLIHQRMHTGEKPYTCSYCGFKCSQWATLRNHETTHTGEKPFQCRHCDYKFSRKSYLTKHQRRRHSGEERH